MESLLSAEIVSACGNLGHFRGKSYIKDPNCKESVRDLIRFLKRDDDDFFVRRQIGQTRVLVADLLPILCCSSDDEELFDYTLRLVVNLTSPALVVFNGKFPQDKTKSRYYLEIVTHLQSYKENVAFNDERLWTVLTKKLHDIVNLDWESRQVEDSLVMERLLILVRNVLHIPAEDEKRTVDDSSIHDQILWVLNRSGMKDLILFIAGAKDEQKYCLHILEIITLIMREQEPEQLARTGMTRTLSEKEKDEQELLEIRHRENAEKKAKQTQLLTSRHSRFGGTFYVKNVQSISERDLLVHNPITKLESINFDKNKVPEKVSKKKLPMKDVDASRLSTFGIRMVLKDACTGFLSNAYNLLMRSAKIELARQTSSNDDESFYFWAIKFFMEFNRHNGCQVEIISETFSVGTMHYIQTQIDTCIESMIDDKENITKWSKRCHKALRAYKELILTMVELEKSKDENIRESCNVIKSNMFYVLEYREMPLKLLQDFDEAKYPRSYLKDLVEMVHIFLKMLEHQCVKTKHLLVEKKKRNARKKKAVCKDKKLEIPETQLEELWLEIAENVSTVIKGDVEMPTVTPFDSASEIPIDDQKHDAMKRIHNLLHLKQVPEALSLLRASREVWPENDLFGSPSISPEDEFLAVREIFFTQIEGVAPPQNGAALNGDGDNNNSDEEMQDGDEDDDFEEREVKISKVEEEFRFSVFIKRFAHWKVVRAYGVLLREFRSNSSFINHCIVKMLHRIAWDCAIPALLFQVSIFRTFQHLLNYPGAEESSRTKEMVKFARFVLSKFFQVAQSSDKVFAELLFWKSARDAIEVVEGYSSTNEQSNGGQQYVWTEEQEEELKKLFERYKDVENIDVVDSIMEHLSVSRTRQQIIRQLQDQRVIGKEEAQKLRKSSSAKQKAVWTPEEIEQVVALYNEHKESSDVLGKILDNLTVKRPKKSVIEKLLELGTVTDRKQLRKKRAGKEGTAKKKSKTAKKSRGKFGADSSEDHEGDLCDDKDESCSQPSNESQNPIKIKKGTAKKYSAIKLEDVLLKAVQEGLSDSVTWIRNELLGIAADRDAEDAIDATPIVYLTEETERALSNKTFKRLLKVLGLREPANEQESFWRCPETLPPARLREMSFILTGALRGDLDMAMQQLADTTQMQNNDAKGEKRKSDGKSSEEISKNKAKLTETETINSNSDESDDDTSITSSANSTSSSEEDSAEELDVDNDKMISKKSTDNVDLKKSSSRSRIIRIDSNDSSDNDTPLETLGDLSVVIDKDKSDIDIPPKENSSSLLGNNPDQYHLGENMDVDDNIPVVRKVGKKRVFVLSDEDDDADGGDSYPARNKSDSLQKQDSNPDEVDVDEPIDAARNDCSRKRIRMLNSDSD